MDWNGDESDADASASVSSGASGDSNSVLRGASAARLSWINTSEPWNASAAASVLRAHDMSPGDGGSNSVDAARVLMPRAVALVMRYAAVGLMIAGSIIAVYGPGGVRASVAAIYMTVLVGYAVHTYARRAMLVSRGWTFTGFLRASIVPEFAVLCAIAWACTPRSAWTLSSLGRGLAYTALCALPDTAAWVLAIWLQRHTSPLSVSVLGNVSGLLIVCADMALLQSGSTLRAATVAGFAVTAVGLALYTYAESVTTSARPSAN